MLSASPVEPIVEFLRLVVRADRDASAHDRHYAVSDDLAALDRQMSASRATRQFDAATNRQSWADLPEKASCDHDVHSAVNSFTP
jgi:hypothetical protein